MQGRPTEYAVQLDVSRVLVEAAFGRDGHSGEAALSWQVYPAAYSGQPFLGFRVRARDAAGERFF